MSTTTEADVQVLNDEPVRAFARLGRGDIDYAGGKGANLGELASAGLPVPDGFVIGAPAYAAFCAETGVRERLAELLDGLNVEDTAALQAASTAAREMFDETPIPEWLRREILAAHEQLVGEDFEAPLAVRSSATAEDTAESSFAGMNETFLNTRAALAGGVYLLKISDEEVLGEGLAHSATLDDLVQALDGLHRSGAETVLISRAEEPALALDGARGRYLQLTGAQVETLEPRGTGDSMFAALGASLASSQELDVALRLATAAGCLNATRHGLGTGTRQQIQRLSSHIAVKELTAPVGALG